jgi:hypothetical protein
LSYRPVHDIPKIISVAWAEQTVDLNEGNVVLEMILDWMDLRGNKIGQSHEFQCLLELPGALVEMKDRQFHENVLQHGWWSAELEAARKS